MSHARDEVEAAVTRLIKLRDRVSDGDGHRSRNTSWSTSWGTRTTTTTTTLRLRATRSPCAATTVFWER